MSSVYVIGQVTIKDPKRWMDYVSRVPATLAEWGGELVMRGQYAAVLSGPPPQPNIVVLRFPDMNAVERWYASDGYQALIPLRDAAANVDLAVYEG